MLLFPPAMLLMASLVFPFALYASRLRDFSANSLKVVVSVSLVVLIAFRSLLSIDTDYGIYTNGPAMLALLFILGWWMSPKSTESRKRAQATVIPGLVTLLGVFCLVAPYYIYGAWLWKPIQTDRGTIYALPGKAAWYQAAIRFIQEKVRERESVLSLPDDASLYFLSGVSSPTRVYSFSPGMLAPGRM